MTPFHTTLRLLIKTRFKNQTEFAAAVGNSQTYISRLMRGMQPVEYKTLLRWARVLRLTPALTHEFVDTAMITRGEIPKDLLSEPDRLLEAFKGLRRGDQERC